MTTVLTDDATVCDNCDAILCDNCHTCGEFHCPDCEECDPLDIAREREASLMQAGWDGEDK